MQKFTPKIYYRETYFLRPNGPEKDPEGAPGPNDGLQNPYLQDLAAEPLLPATCLLQQGRQVL